jgi:hypothetical protein
MAAINPISTSMRMTLNLGVVEGKQVEKTVSIAKLSNTVTPAAVQAVSAALADLLEYPVTDVKQYTTGLLVE